MLYAFQFVSVCRSKASLCGFILYNSMQLSILKIGRSPPGVFNEFRQFDLTGVMNSVGSNCYDYVLVKNYVMAFDCKCTSMHRKLQYCSIILLLFDNSCIRMRLHIAWLRLHLYIFCRCIFQDKPLLNASYTTLPLVVYYMVSFLDVSLNKYGPLYMVYIVNMLVAHQKG